MPEGPQALTAQIPSHQICYFLFCFFFVSGGGEKLLHVRSKSPRYSVENKMNKPKKQPGKLLLEYQKIQKKKLLKEARVASADIPLIQIDGVLMNPKEVLQYVKLRLDSYKEGLKNKEPTGGVCPACGSPASRQVIHTRGRQTEPNTGENGLD